MPIAIVVAGGGTIPAIFQKNTADELVAALNRLKAAPVLNSTPAAKAWLVGLDAPSGWFETIEDARLAIARFKAEVKMTGDELRAIREATHMSRAAFGAAIGFAGNDNTRHKQVFEMEKGVKPIMAEKARAARALSLMEPQ